MDWLLKELDPNSIDVIEESFDDLYNKYMPVLPRELEEEIRAFENENIPVSTRESTKTYSEKFKSFLTENKLSDRKETMPITFLSKYLQFYYHNLKNAMATVSKQNRHDPA